MGTTTPLFSGADRAASEAAEFRETGHRVIDLLADYLETVETRPLFPEVDPRVLEALFDEPPPTDPLPAGEVLDEIEQKPGRARGAASRRGHPRSRRVDPGNLSPEYRRDDAPAGICTIPSY